VTFYKFEQPHVNIMRIYCTIFDKYYLYQGVALYNSLKRCTSEFTLYTLCMDLISYHTIKRMENSSLIPIYIEKLITPEITEVRNRTTHGQFCWVCQPLICEYILNTYLHQMVTYLEADSMFFSDPEAIFRELGENSVSLVPHNYSPGFDNTKIAGQFCVQFNTFRNNEFGHAVLNYWKLNCFKYTKLKPYAYPGQACLNDWPKNFNSVKVIKHTGAGVAPWNIQNATLNTIDNMLNVNGVPIIFYHYHQYGRYEDGSHDLGHYPLSKQVICLIYKPYIKEIAIAKKDVQFLDPTFSYQRVYKNIKSFKAAITAGNYHDIFEYIKVVRRKLRGRFNVFTDEFMGI